ncbi:MAG: ThuA domain-containing protein [Planctomycetes bacterium]|nr:ThuA domain-containing protein [Planctomycetota bacterium]
MVRLARVAAAIGLVILGCVAVDSTVFAADPAPLKVLFLGDNGHHRPRERFEQLQPVMARRGIELVYTEKVEDLNAKTLAAYDALAIYANTERISPEQEQALLDYVAAGKGFVPLHCASYCFLNSPKYIALVGAQFQRHGTGVFRTNIQKPDDPLMKGFRGFESWDETYVHTKHNDADRTILETRTEGDREEPWTWTRTHGKGRVFYTAWGHDARTWSNPGFHNLVERGIRWAAGQDPGAVPAFVDRPEMTPKRKDVKPFEYVEANIPFYPPSRQWGTIGEPIRKMQKPIDPDESVKHMVNPVGLEPMLFAADPKIGKPLCMAWDERGRLWIAETVDYPNELQKPGEGRDRIRICEDTNGDGVADTFKVFADKLSIPTSLTFARGGLIVHQAPVTLFLKDTDGDDVCDEKVVLLDGWGTGDTHAGPSNLHWGLDNWIYGMVGYSGFRGTVGGEQHSFSSGFYRFKPDGSKLEYLRSTNNNSWGVGLSEEGILFGSTANGNPSEYLPIPNRYYEAVRGWSSTVLTGIAESNKFEPITENVRQVDHHGGFTAAAGHALYTARRYPAEYWNKTAFVTEPTGHLIATFVIRPDGAGFRSKNSWNLLASDDEWTAPIAAEVGPDGNVWFIDWYNFIVQHNPTPAGFKTGARGAYETDARDKTHGRIYRLVWNGDKEAGSKSPVIKSLKGATPEQLVAALKSDNMLWRLHAQRLLVERGQADVVPALLALVASPGVDAIGLNPAAMHALWTLHGLGVLDGKNLAALEAAAQATRHPSAGVRRAAVQVLPLNSPANRALVEARLDPQEDAQVRLAALLALADAAPGPATGPRILDVLAQTARNNDRWIADAATAAAAKNSVSFLLEAARRNQPQLTDAAVVPRLTIVAEHIARNAEPERLPDILSALSKALPPVTEAIIGGLEKGWPKNKPVKLGDAGDEGLVKLYEASSPAIGSRLVALAARWGSTKLEQYAAKISEGLLNVIRDEKAEEKDRIAAAVQLVDFRRSDATVAGTLIELITPRTSPDLARGWVEAIGRSEAAGTAGEVIERLGALSPAARTAAIRVLLGRADWTNSLVDAIGEGKLSLSDLSLDQKQALTSHPDRKVVAKARSLMSRGGGLPNPDRQKVVEELESVTREKGDAVAGKEIFKKHCTKCHTHSGEGNRIGPDLTGMAVHPKEELLIHIIDPSRSVEGNFRVYTVVTGGGRVMNGLLASESKTAIELFDSEGKKHAIQRDDIEELVASNKSLMPEGFEKQVTKAELSNLLEFLTQRGKFLPLDLRKVATIPSTKSMFIDENSTVERLVFDDWSPKTVEGVPFLLVNPEGDRVNNAVLLYSRSGTFPNKMPKSVTLPCNAPAKSVHILGGVGGWAFPYGEKGSVSMIVRLKYADGKDEDHPLKNGIEMADYIRKVEVPGSKFAFQLRGQQLRYVVVHPERAVPIKEIELVKGPDDTAPVVMAVTVESP